MIQLLKGTEYSIASVIDNKTHLLYHSIPIMKGVDRLREYVYFIKQEVNAYCDKGLSVYIDGQHITDKDVDLLDYVLEENDYMKDFPIDEQGKVDTVHFIRLTHY